MKSAVPVVLLSLSLAACSSLHTASCPAGSEPGVQELLYFGTQAPTGPVTPEQWSAFVDQTVTPGLPDGFTTWPASGQWRSPATGIVKEPSYVLSVVRQRGLPQDSAIEQIIAAYKARFQQEAVLRVTSAACVRL